MSNLFFISSLFFPLLVWFIIMITIVTTVKSSMNKAREGRYNRNRQTRYGSQQSGRTMPKKVTFEIKKPKLSKKTSFENTGFDDYTAKGRRKDVVTGYDRNYTDSRRERLKRFTHTFDGHEPWDKCLPKEKDPWDKDFRAD